MCVPCGLLGLRRSLSRLCCRTFLELVINQDARSGNVCGWLAFDRGFARLLEGDSQAHLECSERTMIEALVICCIER